MHIAEQLLFVKCTAGLTLSPSCPVENCSPDPAALACAYVNKQWRCKQCAPGFASFKQGRACGGFTGLQPVYWQLWTSLSNWPIHAALTCAWIRDYIVANSALVMSQGEHVHMKHCLAWCSQSCGRHLHICFYILGDCSCCSLP